jgi:hypothetical protein
MSESMPGKDDCQDDCLVNLSLFTPQAGANANVAPGTPKGCGGRDLEDHPRGHICVKGELLGEQEVEAAKCAVFNETDHGEPAMSEPLPSWAEDCDLSPLELQTDMLKKGIYCEAVGCARGTSAGWYGNYLVVWVKCQGEADFKALAPIKFKGKTAQTTSCATNATPTV